MAHTTVARPHLISRGLALRQPRKGSHTLAPRADLFFFCAWLHDPRRAALHSQVNERLNEAALLSGGRVGRNCRVRG